MPSDYRTLRALRLAPSLSCLLILAACASSPPAPIVTRTSPTGTVSRPPPVSSPAPVALPSPPSPAVVVIPPAAPSVQSAPIRSATLEPRPLEPRAADADVRPPADSRAQTPPPASVATAPVVRTEPKGTKVPYTDSALADMRSAESPAVAPAASTGAAAAVARPVEPAKAAEPVGPVEWGWPVNGKVVQGFAESSKGISLSGTAGDPVAAAADGRVIFSGNGPRGYGNLVIVKHANDLLSVYAHNRTLSVKEGQTVKRGQKIAELGETAGAPRLHFEIRQQGKPVDPTTILPRR